MKLNSAGKLVYTPNLLLMLPVATTSEPDMIDRKLKSAWTRLVVAGIALFGLSASSLQAAELYPVTPKAVESTRFRLDVDGQTVFVQKFRDIHYAHFPYPDSHASQVKVTARRAFKTMELSPKAAGIQTELDPGTRTLDFEIVEPGKWVVTMDGQEHLFIFAEEPIVNPAIGVNVLDYGADPSGKSHSTKSIQTAIDDAPSGATVIIPPGHFLSGSLYIKSGISLFLEAGALLQASGNPDHFEPIQNAFIVIEDAENVRLEGRGTIDGSGAYLRHLTDVSGRLLAVRDSLNVNVEGIILRNSRAWNTHIIRSEHVTLRNVKVINDREVLNTDGINPDSSRHVLVEDTFFYCGDDAVAIKSTNREGKFEDVYDITIRDNIMLTQKSALKVGTETHAAEMKDILFENNQVIESDRGMALYARDGTHMHNIRFIGNRFERPFPDYQQRLIDFRMTERYGLSRISDVLIKDNIVDERWSQPSLIKGFSEDHDISNVLFENFVYVGERVLSPDVANIEVGPHTKEVSFR
jgi:hypothetical protein